MLSRKLVLAFTCAAVCILGSAVRAEEGGEQPPPPHGAGGAKQGHRRRPGQFIQMILKNADTLGITADQKAKLEPIATAAAKEGADADDIRKQIEAVLTPEQLTKIKEIQKSHAPGGDKAGGEKAGGDKAPAPPPGGDKGDNAK